MQTDPELSDEIRRFEEQYAENPDSLVFARLADLHRKAGRPERALDILDEGLERHPDYLSAHIVRARCLRALDRRPESEDVFRHVLELDGENLVALRSLAEMAWERGDGEAARDHLEDLLRLDPRNEEARDLLEEIRGEPDEEAPEDDPFVAEDDPFAAEDHPFAGGEDREEAGEDVFEAPDDPFAPASDAGPGASEVGTAGLDEGPGAVGRDDEGAGEMADATPGEPEQGEKEGAEDDLIIEPTSRRQAGADRATEEPPTAGEPGPGEASPPAEEPEAPEAPRGEEPRARAFDVEPAEPDADEATAAEGPDPTRSAPEPEPEAARPAGAEPDGDEDGGRWWDFLRPGGGDEPEGPAPEADEASGVPGPGEGTGGPAIGPGDEAEELRAQIEELRMRAEQETDLSDADEDLATETLANLYEAQGFYREAVEMYEELAAQRPEDEELRQRLVRAREALEETGQSAVTAAEQLRAVLRGDASPEGPGAPGS